MLRDNARTRSMPCPRATAAAALATACLSVCLATWVAPSGSASPVHAAALVVASASAARVTSRVTIGIYPSDNTSNNLHFYRLYVPCLCRGWSTTNSTARRALPLCRGWAEYYYRQYVPCLSVVG